MVMLVLMFGHAFGRAFTARRNVRSTQDGLVTARAGCDHGARAAGAARRPKPCARGGVRLVRRRYVEVVDVVVVVRRRSRASSRVNSSCKTEHGRLDDFAAGGVDGVGDVGVELGPAVGVAGGPVLVELAAALVAEAGPQMVLAAAAAGSGR